MKYFISILFTQICCLSSLLARVNPWTLKTDMPTGRMALSCSTVNGKIYLMGGVVNGAKWSDPALPKVDEYDPTTDTRDDTTRIEMPTSRAYLSTSVIDGKIYAFGGRNNEATFNGLTTLEIYDPTTNTWDTTKADLPAGRVYLKSSAADSMIYVFSGSTNPYNLPASTVWQYNPAADTFKEVSPMPIGIMPAAASEADGKIYQFGGTDTTLSVPAKVSSEVFEYNLHNDTLVAIKKDDKNSTDAFSLCQNYPNPFNPSTTIAFDLPKTSEVSLKVFDILGEEVTTLVLDRLSAGSYSYEWDARNLASGLYLYQLKTDQGFAKPRSLFC